MHEPYWWDTAGPPAPTAEQDLPAEADVLVIGAGLTGLSAARTLARAGKSVLVVDAGPPGIGASSRNGGMIGGGHRVAPDALQSRYGRDTAARLLNELHIDSTSFAISVMQEEAIECDFAKTGRFHAQWLPSHYESAAKNLDLLRGLAPVEAEIVPKSRQREVVASDLYHGGVLYHHHGGLNPAKWVAGMRRAAERAGAVVQGHTPVTALRRAGARHVAATPRGMVSAGETLVATNGYTRGQFGTTGRHVFAIPSFIIVTEELGENRVRSLFPNSRMIVETRERHCYYRPSPDNRRVVFGGRAALFQAPEWFFRRELRKLMTGVFPELKDTAVTHSWKGNTGFTFALSPHVGKIDGVWHAMGYCGNGNGMAPYLGHKAGLQILGDPEGETAFSEIPLPGRWWYKRRPWFVAAADPGFRARDAWATFQSRRTMLRS